MTKLLVQKFGMGMAGFITAGASRHAARRQGNSSASQEGSSQCIWDPARRAWQSQGALRLLPNEQTLLNAWAPPVMCVHQYAVMGAPPRLLHADAALSDRMLPRSYPYRMFSARRTILQACLRDLTSHVIAYQAGTQRVGQGTQRVAQKAKTAAKQPARLASRASGTAKQAGGGLFGLGRQASKGVSSCEAELCARLLCVSNLL